MKGYLSDEKGAVAFADVFLKGENIGTTTDESGHFILNSLKLLCGVTWRIEGLNNLPNKACILVSNHQGAWESFFLQTLYHPSSSNLEPFRTISQQNPKNERKMIIQIPMNIPLSNLIGPVWAGPYWPSVSVGWSLFGALCWDYPC